MKITNFNFVNTMNTLNSFGDKKLPQKISYAITKNLITLQKEYEVYVKMLNDLYTKYDADIIHDENGERIVDKQGIPELKKEAKEAFFNELTEFLNMEIDIDMYLIPDDVFNYDDMSGRYDAMSASDIIMLRNILCEQK